MAKSVRGLGSNNRDKPGQPAFSYKHNESFMGKQGMSRTSPVKQAGLAHPI